MLRTCTKCLGSKPEKSFAKTSSGYRRRVCHTCQSRVKRGQADPTLRRDYQRKHREENPHIYVLVDCRMSDRRNKRTGNDLDTLFVEAALSNGCQYCGDTSLRMTLDRIDNTRAHAKDNVVPCCLRCNYIRGSMPYEAWLHMVPTVREAREQGLFGDWRSQPLNKRPKDP